MKKINTKILTFIGVLFLILLVSDTVSADPGTAQGLNKQVTITGAITPTVTETGKISLSVDGLGTLSDTGTIQVQKPQGATVKEAYLIAASTGFGGDTLVDGDVKINNQDVSWTDKTPSAISSYSYWADVTSIVKPIVDSAPAGLVNLDITETKTYDDDGEILAVIFDDPNQKTDNTIVLLFGAQATEGDTFNIKTSQPIDLTDPKLAIDMGLGISFGYQEYGGDQYSLIDVNTKRLTTSAGGEDDGDHGNGALLTVGGIGDSNDNPSNPNATPTDPRSDDELYNLLPFVSQGDTKISVYTQNPSTDDNIFFGYFDFKSTGAVVGEGIVLSPLSATTYVGATHKLTATVQDNSGNPVIGTTVTFEITDGPNKGKSSTATTDANGTATFSYTGKTAGTDTIVASFINSQETKITSNEVTNTWISTLPVASFSAKPTSGKAPINVAFTDTSKGKPTKWKWTFGDGATSTKQNPIHKYSKAGNYTVALTAANAAGSSTVTKKNYIIVFSKPAASLSASPTSGKAPLTVAFTDKSSGNPTKWKWSFGDGATSRERNPKHQYLQEGNYKITLTVSNAAGSSTITKTNFIKVTTNTRPGIYSQE